MLMFVTKHCLKLMSNHRHFIWENPVASAMWTQSAADTLNVDPRVKTYTLDMCRFSPAPDGQRHKKRTKLKSSLTLTKVVQKCTCRKGHIMLQGFDRNTHQSRTSQAAMYFKRYCYALCADLTAGKLIDSSAMTTSIFNEDEQDIPGDPIPADDAAPAPPVQSLTRISVSSISLESDQQSTAGHLLLRLDQQLLKACIVDLFDQVGKFKQGTQPTGRAFLRPGMLNIYETAHELRQLLLPVYQLTAVCCTIHHTQLYNFGHADEE